MELLPRDQFMLYQEKLQRQDEGDEIDESAYKKVEVKLQHISKTGSVAVVTFNHEDHTVGNPLRHVLMQNPKVSTAGYSIPHPLEPKMLVHVQTEDYAVDVVCQGLERIASLCEEISANFEEALKKAVTVSEADQYAEEEAIMKPRKE
eukprot:GILI01023772.1.p1 GENE.GILI01023772.1~~GILI01023772.1.p1  ORF type:complete len:148 (+),score=44.53 GILI01023772.1:68-511(+)